MSDCWLSEEDAHVLGKGLSSNTCLSRLRVDCMTLEPQLLMHGEKLEVSGGEFISPLSPL